jgi:glutaminase
MFPNEIFAGDGLWPVGDHRMKGITEAHLSPLLQPTQIQAHFGRLPTYIPCLAEIDISLLGVAIQTDVNKVISLGDVERPFVLMSVIKPFLLLYLLHQQGKEAVFARVGMEVSEQSFHSVSQLATDRGRPRNPMINSGAISLAGLLPGKTADARCESLRQWLNTQAGCNLQLDHRSLSSVRALSNESNRSIANLLQRAGYLEDLDLVLETYNQICCLSGTLVELGRLGLLLAKRHTTIESSTQSIVNSIMLTCGLYESSNQYALRIGLPTKSGVSGGLLAIVPREGAIAIYSPAIDDVGNSVGGLFLLEQLVQQHQLSLFHP